MLIVCPPPRPRTPDWCVGYAGEGEGAVPDPPQESAGSHKGTLQAWSGDEEGGGTNRKR